MPYTTRPYTPEDLLNARMQPNDAEAGSVRDYLHALLLGIWEEGVSFSSKRPFGNSSWWIDLGYAFLYTRYASGDENGEPDYDETDALVRIAINHLFLPRITYNPLDETE